MSTKKCACFTPSGLVYTRLETDGTIARRPGEIIKENVTRSRRSIDNDVYEPNTVDSILEENPSIGHLSFRNEPIDEQENMYTRDKIDKLITETEAFLEAYERTKENIDHKRTKRRAQHNWNHNKHKKKDAIINNNESSLECKIEKDGTVNCSQIIYNDLKAWHTNRLSLEDQIRQLKTKLEDLKEIKRHLKTAKPVTEIQTVHPALIDNHLFNNNVTHERTSSKEHSRKTSRVHRIKPKHRNSTSQEKKLRQSNEYVVPIHAKTKEDVFGIQTKNETTTITPTTLSHTTNITNEVGTAINDTNYKAEILKQQMTTTIIDANYLDQTSVEDAKSTILTTDPEITTEFTKYLDVTTKHSADSNSSDGELFVQKVNIFSSAIDAILSTERSSTQSSISTLSGSSTTNSIISTSTINPISFKHTTMTALNLGPARLDASEYEQRNPNKRTSKIMGIFDKPVDVFQKRLHPLFIENEDKHVCYCEENRYVFI